MLDFVAAIRSPLRDRLEAVSRARRVPAAVLVEEAVARLLETEEHCDQIARAFAEHERARKRPARRPELAET